MQQGPHGAYVYIIDKNMTVRMQPIHVAQIDHGQALIDQGLAANEQVVVDGQYQLEPGAHVTDPPRQGRARGSAKRGRARGAMNISATFIARPIATILLMVGLLLCGLVTYRAAAGRGAAEVNFPTIQVTAQLPGADPQTMASSVATPLEQQFAQIPGVTQLTSASALGYTQITMQFDLSRDIDWRGSDVLSAINAASAHLPLEHAVSADHPEGQSGRHADPGARRSPRTRCR